MHPFLSGLFERISAGSRWNNEQILREEIFSIERLEQHAQSLAAAQPVTRQPGFRRSLGARLRNNEKVLLAAYRSIARAVDEGRSITPAAEWVLDNYHVVEEQIREIREDLPAGFYRQLPKLAEGPFAGFPRVFGIAWAYVAHTDSRFEPESLRRFVRAYQTVQPLTIGELWAVAITLRVVLVENLRRVAQRIVISRAAREQADAVADRLLGVNGQAVDPRALDVWKRRAGQLTPAFAVQLVQRRGRGVPVQSRVLGPSRSRARIEPQRRPELPVLVVVDRGEDGEGVDPALEEDRDENLALAARRLGNAVDE